ncbi:DUF192 domain-containing protein [uncultured Croceitalea sp.]|uniref:DUF192 domain-containing protein n=1 Tax=uncultured Croceitalea sp. TaxID=1798908 RepID=UPI00374FB7B5
MSYFSRYFVISLSVFLIVFNSCKGEKKTEIKTEIIDFTKEGGLSIFKKDSLLVNLDIEIADTDYERETGLMHRTSMKESQGMLFIQKELKVQNFYMKNTVIPLDLIFIDDNLNIVSFQENTKPFNESSLSSQVPAKYVLEVNAGLAEKWLLEVGDSISFSR